MPPKLLAVVFLDQHVPFDDSPYAYVAFGDGLQRVVLGLGDGGVRIADLSIRTRTRQPVWQLVAVEARVVAVAFDATHDRSVGIHHGLRHEVRDLLGAVAEHHAVAHVDASELEDLFLGPVEVLLLEFLGKSHEINIAKKTPKSASFLEI